MAFSFEQASAEQVAQVRQLALNIPGGLSADSVINAREYVIIKLAHDNWSEELLIPTLSVFSTKDVSTGIVPDGSLLMHVKNIMENRQIIVSGWAYLKNVVFSTAVSGIFLYDSQEDRFY